MPPARRAQRLDVAFPFLRIVKVVAHDHVPYAQALRQQLLLELARAEISHAVVEPQHHDAIDTVQRQCLELLAQPHQARRSRRAFEEFARCRLERHHGGRQAEFVGLAPQGLQHVLVAAMHAVEVADRRHATAMLRTQVVQAAHQLQWTTHDDAPSGRAGIAIAWCRRSRKRMPSTYSVPK